MDIPNPFEPADVVADPLQQYLVHVFTAVSASGTYKSEADFQLPTEGNYFGQLVAAAKVKTNGASASAELEPALFSGAQFSTQVNCVGFVVYAVFDNGNVLMGHRLFPAPRTIGPNLPNLNIAAELTARGIPDAITIAE